MELTRDRKKLIAIALAAAAAGGIGGVLLTRDSDPAKEQVAASAEGEGGEDMEGGEEKHAEGFVEMCPDRIRTAGRQ